MLYSGCVYTEGETAYIPSISGEAVEAIKNTCEPVTIEVGCEWSNSVGFRINEINVSVYDMEEARLAISCNLLVGDEDISVLRSLSHDFNKVALREFID